MKTKIIKNLDLLALAVSARNSETNQQKKNLTLQMLKRQIIFKDKINNKKKNPKREFKSKRLPRYKCKITLIKLKMIKKGSETKR